MDSRPLVWAPAHPELDKLTFFEPQRKTAHAAAYDLYLPDDVYLTVGDSALIDLNLLCCMPQDERAVFRMRSSLARDYQLQILGGVIDSDYAESWKVMVYVPRQHLNRDADKRVTYDPTSQEYLIHFTKGERIAQVKFEKVPAHAPRTGTRDEVVGMIQARGSDRTGGFGSTGA